jgi:transposase
VRTGRPKQPLIVDPADREKLTLLARRPKTAQRAAIRSKIVLRAAEDLSNQEIARQLGITGSTVGKWRERYGLHGMKGLADDSRSGTPRRITDSQVEEAVTRTLESMPAAATQWSTRSLLSVAAKKCAILAGRKAPLVWLRYGRMGVRRRDITFMTACPLMASPAGRGRTCL